MKTALNLIGLAGYAALTGGIYLQWGEPVALMSGGTLALLFALKALSVQRGVSHAG